MVKVFVKGLKLDIGLGDIVKRIVDPNVFANDDPVFVPKSGSQKLLRERAALSMSLKKCS